MTDSPGLPDREPDIRTIAPPSQTNPGGTVFGGWLMGMLDSAASAPALARARGPVVTAAVDRLRFHRPIRAGEQVSIYAQLRDGRRGRMVIEVAAYSRRLSRPETVHRVASGQMVFMAVDGEGRPRPLPDE